MLVYRVEHEVNKQGPYVNYVTCMGRHYGDNCPSPRDDGIVHKWDSSTYYGFKSKKDAVSWFGKDYLTRFSHSRCHVYAYRVDASEVSLGCKHLGFNINKANRVRRIYPYEFD